MEAIRCISTTAKGVQFHAKSKYLFMIKAKLESCFFDGYANNNNLNAYGRPFLSPYPKQHPEVQFTDGLHLSSYRRCLIKRKRTQTVQGRKKNLKHKGKAEKASAGKDNTGAHSRKYKGSNDSTPILLVDGYNICGHCPKLKKHFLQGRLSVAREKLIYSLAELSSMKGMKVVVAFDASMSGLPSQKEFFGGVEIVFATRSSADIWIKEKVRELKEDGISMVIVATSDATARETSYVAGAYLWSSARLIDEIAETRVERKEMEAEARFFTKKMGTLGNCLKPGVVHALQDLKKKLES